LYQIYPRSFFDKNNDGVGDIPGIISKLDYIKSLNVDGLWVCPFYQSPMVDFGYDVSDYRNVDPLFGSTEDLKQLISESHQRDLKVIVDLVLSHTSEQHEWFKKSVEEPDSKYGEYYVWHEGSDRPNNWLSVFGGPAWSFHQKRGAWYFHNFLKEQPDLNLHNPDVQAELIDIAKYWLEKGVDGFRLDACNCYFHDPSLKDNPIGATVEVNVQDETNPYFQQVHLYDKSQPENVEFLNKLRSLVDTYDSKLLLGEIFCEREEETTREYTGGGKPLHSAYNFSLLRNERAPGMIRDAVMTYYSISPQTAWSFSNHDVTRVVSRWGDGHSLETRAKAYNTLLCGLPGLVILYQGEELGLPEAILPKEKQFDPFGSNIDSSYPGRDGCRTPIPWSNMGDYCGFSTVEPWLPIPENHRERDNLSQDKDPQSVLNHLRKLMKLRNGSDCIRKGKIHFWLDNEDAVVFARQEKGLHLVFGANFSQNSVEWKGVTGINILDSYSKGIFNDENKLIFAPGSFGVIEIKEENYAYD
ncbi:MAG: alpha-amylase family glycosyl hydrolase, partial [Halobacteriovoraceae bacterium]|nr:alpha-amylase family glycosyl hydrolase [Halobacteriovoraceae bacterium]